LTETLTESFCERCGTRYEFEAPTRMNPLRKTRGFIGGLKQWVTSQDDMSDAMRDAMRLQEEALAAAQLEAFHESFNFCIDCRQYTCVNCWNDGAGRCRSCAPIPGTDDLAERLTAAMAGNGTAAVAEPVLADDEVERRLGLEAWPMSDLPSEPVSATHADAVWPDADAVATPEPEAEPEPEPVVAEVEPEPVVAEEPEPVVVAEVEPEAEPVVAEQPEPVIAEEPEPVVVAEVEPEAEPVVAEEPEPVVAEPVLERRLRVVAWEPDAPYETEEPAPAAAAWEVEPEPVVAEEVEPEPVVAEEVEPEPVVAQEPEVEPEPVVAEEVEVEPEPVVAEEVEAEPEPVAAEAEPEAEPASRIPPIRETILRFPDREAPGQRQAAEDESPEVAARRAQLDLLGLGDPGEGPVEPARPAVLPYRSRGAAAGGDLAARVARAGGSSFWDASAREVAGAAASIGVQNCGECGLSLSANARFCRRCGTRQARSA